jgi:hypothetical protein
MPAEPPLSTVLGATMLALAAGQFPNALSDRESRAEPSLLLAQSAELAESAPPEYRGWIGKRLVRNTEIYNGPEPVVREADLPHPYRLFTPSRSMGDMMYDPERTNVFVDARSIIARVWKG